MTRVAAAERIEEPPTPAVPLHRLLVPCLVSFAAWEGARLLFARVLDPVATEPLVLSVVRAVLLLTPAAWVTRRLLRERLVAGFWLGRPERKGLPRSCLIGAVYLVAINALGALTGQPFVMPALALGALVLTLFDAAVEEALFRGFLLSHLLQGRSFARANLLSAGIFVLPHTRKLVGFWDQGFRFEIGIMALSIFVLGLVLAATARPVRSIAIATLVHTIANLFATM